VEAGTRGVEIHPPCLRRTRPLPAVPAKRACSPRKKAGSEVGRWRGGGGGVMQGQVRVRS